MAVFVAVFVNEPTPGLATTHDDDTVLQCYSVTVLQCYSVTVLRCYEVTRL